MTFLTGFFTQKVNIERLEKRHLLQVVVVLEGYNGWVHSPQGNISGTSQNRHHRCT